jgi:hypothetical protein
MAAAVSRQNQWGVLTEGKRKNELANKTEVRFKKTIMIIRGGTASAHSPSVSAADAGSICGNVILN